MSITSWNEWGEGTQIEPCQPWTDPDTGNLYKDYGAGGPWLYLNITQQEASDFIQLWHDKQKAQLPTDTSSDADLESSSHGAEAAERVEL